VKPFTCAQLVELLKDGSSYTRLARLLGLYDRAAVRQALRRRGVVRRWTNNDAPVPIIEVRR